MADSLPGDFTPEQKSKDEKIILERKVIKNILYNLPETIQIQYLKIWEEYVQNKSIEANLVHQIDKFEMALQAKIYQKQTNSENIKIFFESAKKEIDNSYLLTMLEKLCEK